MNAAAELTELYFGKFVPPKVTATYTHLMDAPHEVELSKQQSSGGRKKQLLALGDATRHRIKIAMGRLSGKTLPELVVGLNLSRSAVNAHMKILMEQGHITRKRVSLAGGGYSHAYYLTVPEKPCNTLM